MQGKETIGSIQKKLEQKRGLDFKRLFGELPQIKKIQIIGIKKNRLLEVWVMRDNVNGGASSVKLAEYEFTNYSGIQGPKLMRGDRQIPEGFYGIEYLNPNSKFYLSLKLTFPNAFDLEMGEKR
jgi:murein L,D-transpeptidase YafK